AAYAELFAPDEWFTGATAARGKLPFSFRRQTFAGPLRIGLGVFVSDVHDGIILFALEIAVWSQWMLPVRAGHVTPPLKMIVERHRMSGRRENHRTGDQIFRRRAGKVFSFRSSLGYGDVSGSFHEFSELLVGDIGPVHEEAVDINAMNG